jgi:hypothetical protein
MPVIRRKHKTFSYSRGMGLINRTKKTRRPKSRHVQRGHRCWLHPTPIHTHLDYLSTGYGYGHGPVAIDATAAVPRQPFHPARTRGRRETAIHLCIPARCWLCSLAAWFRPSPTVKLPGPKKGNSCAPKPACTKTPAGRSVRRDHAHACQPGTRASVCVCRVGWASLNTLPQHGTKWRGTPGAAAPPMRQNTRPD